MNYFLVAGEASGDLHASNLMRALKEVDKEADFRYFGGDLMQSVGGTLVKHYRNMAFMGFIPVLMHLRTIFRNMDACKKAIEEYRPDVVILVDYPGFNLKIAKEIGVHGARYKVHANESCTVHRAPKVYYYISPKIWAWKEYRIKDIQKYVDELFSILPFEVEYYQKHQFPVNYVGNPTVDALANREYKNETFEEFTQTNHLDNKPVIALLAGSRKQEIKDNLPTMLEAAAPFDDYQLVIAGAPGIDPAYYEEYTKNHRAHIVFGQTYRLLQQAQAALVTSGTATLETALFRVPQTVCYKVPLKHVSSFIFEKFFSCKYISLVNLIAGKTVVKELFGKYFSTKQIREELDLLLHDETYRKKMDEGYQEVIEKLGQAGASEKAARSIYAKLRKKTN
ncbi:MAG: lipid-A-disaccharide synthase [Candidatus Symbiothrix sp.]|jgi:lipid-A-disaccharide synthase|nr:lipid-A-disaccharide synthase [Candidatus Symbiothrix sp.]